MAQEDTGLVKRGLALLLLMSVLVVVLLLAMFQRTSPTLPAASVRPETHAAALVRVVAPFPGSIAWPALFQVGELMPSPRGWEIRYNAAQALARRGSDNVPWDTIREMLDEAQQLRNFRARLQDGRDVPDEAAARGTVLTALRAVAEWHRKQAQKDLSATVKEQLLPVYAAVDKLSESPIVELKAQAENARKLFFR